MQRIKITQNFYLDELVPPSTYFLTDDRGKSIIENDAIHCMQLLRSLKGSSIGCNSWWRLYEDLHEKGDMTINEIIEYIEASRKVSKWSGYRPPHCTVGAKRSMHREGKAYDPKGDQMQLFEIVRKNAKDFYKAGLRRLENPSITKGWLHMDISESRHKEGFIRVVNWSDHAFDINAETGKICNINNLNGFKL